jgi:hypothetical protein
MTTPAVPPLPTPSPLERLAAGYRPTDPPPRPAQTRQPAPPPPTSEERFARSYDSEQHNMRDQRGRYTAPPAHKPPPPPKDSELALARTYAPLAGEAAADSSDEQNDTADANNTGATDGPGGATDSPPAELRAPNGFEELDPDTASGLSRVADELQLRPGAMQAIVDKVSPMLVERSNRRLAALMDQWSDETTSDPEIGGTNLDASIAHARKALDVHGSPELRQLLGPLSAGGTGIGNNVAMLRFLAKVGRASAGAVNAGR